MELYRKYRPETFEEVIGNEEIVEGLQNNIKKKEHSHTYLFTGIHGGGKTTFARIMAKSVGCSPENIFELNSSNTRGIDTARQIQDEMVYTTFDGTPKAYIIDEVHKATNDFQNAMLKPLEDTPDHVYFFLCTTDPQKLIKPLKSRCTSFNIEPLGTKFIKKIVKKAMKKENIELDTEIFRIVVKKSNGSPRDALTLLESIMNIKGVEKQKKLIANAVLGADSPEIVELCKELLKNKPNWKITAKIIKSLKDKEPESIRWAVMGYMNAVLLNSGLPRAAIVLESFSEPFYNTGKNGLTLACYDSIFAE